MLVGCPENYTAQIVAQPGNMTGYGATPPALGQLVDIVNLEWGRIDTATSNANITITKCAENCQLLRGDNPQIDPIATELWIYRDGKPAWRGPVIRISESSSQNTFTITAQDISWWFDRRMIGADVTFVGVSTTVAFNLITRYFTPLIFPPFLDGVDPQLVDGMHLLTNSTVNMNIDYDANQYTVGQKLADLENAGVRWTVVDRNILIRSIDPPNNTTPHLIDASDIIGDIELVKDGSSYGNHMIGLGEGFSRVSVPTAAELAYFGRVTLPPVRFNDLKTTAEVDTALATTHRQHRNMGFQLVIPAGSTLSPNTVIHQIGYHIASYDNGQIALDLLVPGTRFDIQVGEEFCQPGRYPTILNELRVTWDADQGETVAVSLTYLPQPA